MKFGHIGFGVKNVTDSKKFYDAIAPHVGLQCIGDKPDFVGYSDNDSYQFYFHNYDNKVSGLHVCFEVDSRELVDEFYNAALAADGTDHGAPGIREDYSPTYYAAFVLDPDGNNIEAVCRS